MMISKKALSRRTVLRGLGTAVALPLLDSMLPAFTAVARSAAAPINRFGVMYVPNGMIMQNWAPVGVGVGYQFNTTMAPLAPFRNQMTVISGLNCIPPAGTRAGDGVHARAARRGSLAYAPLSTNVAKTNLPRCLKGRVMASSVSLTTTAGIRGRGGYEARQGSPDHAGPRGQSSAR